MKKTILFAVFAILCLGTALPVHAKTIRKNYVVMLVQQLEGGMLSPQLMSETTRLHPIVVLLCVMAGGAAGGVAGVLLAIPAVLCVRAALRVIQLKRLEEQFEET